MRGYYAHRRFVYAEVKAVGRKPQREAPGTIYFIPAVAGYMHSGAFCFFAAAAALHFQKNLNARKLSFHNSDRPKPEINQAVIIRPFILVVKLGRPRPNRIKFSIMMRPQEVPQA